MSALGQKQTNHRGPKSTYVRYAPNSDQILRRSEMTLCAISDIAPLARSKIKKPSTEVANLFGSTF
jgi:hypothetical protein